MMFHFYNTFLNPFSTSSIFSGGIVTTLTSLEFSSITGFAFRISLAILFPAKSPVASAALRTTF